MVLAIAAAQTGDPALVARANDMLRAFVGHNPLQRPGTTLTSSAMVMPEGGDGVSMLRSGRDRLGGGLDIDALVAHLAGAPVPDPVPRIALVE